MNNQVWLTTRSRKLKLQRANSQTISSYHVRFSTDTVHNSNISFLLFCIDFFCFYLFFFSFFCFLFAFFWNKKYNILIHIRLCGRQVIKFFSLVRFPETKLLSFLAFNLNIVQTACEAKVIFKQVKQNFSQKCKLTKTKLCEFCDFYDTLLLYPEHLFPGTLLNMSFTLKKPIA